MRIVLIGPPGSGKGTQGQRLARALDVPLITPAELLREAVASGTALGEQTRHAMERGQAVGDEVVIALLRERIGRPDAARGFVLHDYPRNIPQADALERLLHSLSMPLDAVLLIELGQEALLRRISGRRTCEGCGAVYNVHTRRPQADDRCDICGGTLRRRSDDREDAVLGRLRVYAAQTLPLTEFLRRRGNLHRIDGAGDVEDIYARIDAAIGPLPEVRDEVAEALPKPRRSRKMQAEGADVPPLPGGVAKRKRGKGKPAAVAEAADVPPVASVEAGAPLADDEPKPQAKKAAKPKSARKKTGKAAATASDDTAGPAVPKKKGGRAGTARKAPRKKGAEGGGESAG